MKVNKKEFKKAQDFILKTLNESTKKFGQTKKSLQHTVELIETEFKNTKKGDYQISLMYLANEMDLTMRDFTSHKSQ